MGRWYGVRGESFASKRVAYASSAIARKKMWLALARQVRGRMVTRVLWPARKV
jgi:hypothetical protein